MKYRQFNSKIEWQPSALGFGLMRLPLVADGKLDMEESIRIVRYAIDNGVNYLDTAYIYHGGESEPCLAKILKDGYREKVKIADKMPLWLVKEEADLNKIFFDQLKRLEVDKIDFYLLHSLAREPIPMFEKYRLIEWLEKKRADGFIDYIGFSFHDDSETLKKIVKMYSWDFCLLQFNLIDAKNLLTIEDLRFVKSQGLGIIIMEGLRGGQLTLSIPDDIQKMWAEMPTGVDQQVNPPVQQLLDFVWNYEEVGFIISGMSNFQQVKENIEYAKQSSVKKVNTSQFAHYERVREAYLNKIAINCTDCKYCKDCPQKLPIPFIFNILNEINRYQNDRAPRFSYNFLPEEQRANKCTSCGFCNPLCPQKLDIPALLAKCSKVFDDKEEFGKVFI